MTLHDNQTGALVVQDLDLDIADARAEYLEDLDQWECSTLADM